MSVLKKAGRTSIVAGVGMLAVAGAAKAECWVSDEDKRGLFGAKHYQTEFQGAAGVTSEDIWQKYCKPYIQRNVVKHNIMNGEFGMACWGRYQCNIQGSIQNGQLVPLIMEF